jgi:hypothetical protein
MTITVQAFLLCNFVSIDETSRNTNILGIFDVILAKRFPATHMNCAVYARLHLWDEPRTSLSILMEAPAMTKTQLLAPMEMKSDLNGKTRSEYFVTAGKRRATTS